jgi:ABC-type Fe3+ transport system permease subunit
MTHGTQSTFSDNVWLYIIAAQIIAALPFASRAMFSSWKRVPEDLLLISKTLGASKWQIFHTIIWPIMKSAILVAILFSFAISIGEFGATFFLVRGKWITLSLAIHRLFASRTTILPNFFACILVLTALFSFWIIEKIGSMEMKL